MVLPSSLCRPIYYASNLFAIIYAYAEVISGFPLLNPEKNIVVANKRSGLGNAISGDSAGSGLGLVISDLHSNLFVRKML